MIWVWILGLLEVHEFAMIIVFVRYYMPLTLTANFVMPVARAKMRLFFGAFVLTELVSYMYLTYVHNMHIYDVLPFLFGSRHRPYWHSEVRSKSE